MKKIFNIIFMGTPEFALPALKALHKTRHHLSLVVTQPDHPRGRGRKVLPTPVKKTAQALGYDVIQPISVRTVDFKERIAGLQPDLIVAAAFGHILPKALLDLPRIGTINIHASLLPKYRGPSPIQWALINREKYTGVTIILVDEGLDTGDILLSEKVEIADNDTSATLHDRLSVLGADLMLKTLNNFASGSISPVHQDHDKATYTSLLKKKDGQIDWKMAANSLDAFIRGMTPWPGAFTFCGNKRLKILKAKPVSKEVDHTPGTVIAGFPDELLVAAGKGCISILEIQAASGKRLLIKDFLQGCSIPPGTVLLGR